MRDKLFRFLFPSQYEQIKWFQEILKVRVPDFTLTALDGVCFKNVRVYLVTDFNGSVINSVWSEIPYEEVIGG